jgi:hypothetical protein
LLKNHSCFETLLTELLSTNGFSMKRKHFPFVLRRRVAPSRRTASFFNGLLRIPAQKIDTPTNDLLATTKDVAEHRN